MKKVWVIAPFSTIEMGGYRNRFLYLSNVLLINLCSKIGIFSLNIPPFINVPIMVIMLIVILSVMLLVMNKIPIIKKATGLNNNLNKG